VNADLAARYPTRFLRAYVRGKLRYDPVYEAVAERLQGNDDPLLDVGCGIGVLPLFLRARGFEAPIRGVDHDERKVAVARAVVPDVDFRVADARTAIRDATGTVLMLDLLHYFRAGEQAEMLAAAAAQAKTVILRDAIRDASWRYRLTYAQESFSRAVRWLRAERLHFAARDEVMQPFGSAFTAEVVPLYGRTPFNNYLFVFKRAGSGTTNA
jgi:SAM-dependent methyltransferase